MRTLIPSLIILSLTACTSVAKKHCYQMSITLSHQVICTTIPQYRIVANLLKALKSHTFKSTKDFESFQVLVKDLNIDVATV